MEWTAEIRSAQTQLQHHKEVPSAGYFECLACAHARTRVRVQARARLVAVDHSCLPGSELQSINNQHSFGLSKLVVWGRWREEGMRRHEPIKKPRFGLRQGTSSIPVLQNLHTAPAVWHMQKPPAVPAPGNRFRHAFLGRTDSRWPSDSANHQFACFNFHPKWVNKERCMDLYFFPLSRIEFKHEYLYM